MQPTSVITVAALGAIALIGVFIAQDRPLLSFVENETIIAGAANIILVYFVLALLVERACEVAMDLLTATGVLAPKDPSDATSVPHNRRAVSMGVCLVFSVAISLAGLRMVEMILVVATGTDPNTPAYFSAMDVVLTALILSGGADGVHQILRGVLGEKPPAPADG